MDVIQEVEYVKQEAKMVYLLECLQKTPPPVIIFSDNKNEVDDIQEYLLLKGVEAVAIHGSKSEFLRPNIWIQCNFVCVSIDPSEQLRTRENTPFVHSSPAPKTSWSPLAWLRKVLTSTRSSMSSCTLCRRRSKTTCTRLDERDVRVKRVWQRPL